MQTCRLGSALVAIVFAFCLTSEGATITVAPGGHYTEIQPAIDAAEEGDTVLVARGEYVITEPIDFNRLHDPEDPASPPVKNISLRSEAGVGETTIRMSKEPADPDRARVVIFQSGETDACVIEGFTLTGGKGGVYCRDDSSPTLINCTISGNSGVGVDCRRSSPTLINCTISGNSGSGVYCGRNSSATLASCVVWGNAGESLLVHSTSNPGISYSCIEGDEVWPGVGNLNEDPLFCGWPGAREVFVDAAGGAGGDGTPGNLCSALGEFSLSLHRNSPCIGRGESGATMGADTGICAARGEPERTIHLAPGTYSIDGCSLVHRVSLLGAGAEETVIEGTVLGLRTGTVLRDVTVTKGTEGGVVVGAGESPVIEDCTISGNSGYSGGGVRLSGNSSPTFTNCRISGNSAQYGGGMYCSNSSPGFTNCTISGNSAESWGGGLVCAGESSPTLANCAISGNSGYSGGGVYCDEDSSPTLTNSTISGNWAGKWTGGGVRCRGNSHPTFTNCTISGNWADSAGGVDCGGDSSPTLTNCVVWDNGGGSLAVESSSNPTVSCSCIEGDEVWPGVGNLNEDPLFCGWPGAREVFVDAAGGAGGDGTPGNPFSDLSLALAEFSLSLHRDSPCIEACENGATMGADTGVCDARGEPERVIHLAAGMYSLEGHSLCHQVSVIGAGAAEIVIEGTVFGLRTGAVLRGLTVTKGMAGGIVVGPGESPTIEDCTISGNSAERGGGGVYSGDDSSPVFTNCTVSGNWAAWGGGLCSSGCSPTFTNCTIRGNSAGEEGGGVSFYGSSPTLTNCTISGNFAGEQGGGVLCWDSSPTLTYCTLWGNSASARGGGVYSYWDSAPRLTNCIVWHNSLESILDVDSTAGVIFSCIEGETVWPGEGNTNADPLLVAPGWWEPCDDSSWNGCVPSTWTTIDGRLEPVTWARWIPGDLHPQASSPCIDSGTCAGAPGFDIEGNERPFGAGCDMGAYEFSVPPEFRRGDCNDDGVADISDAVCILNWLFMGGTAPGCLAVTNTNGDAGADLSDAVYLLGHLFLGGPAPVAPFPACGPGLLDADEVLGCDTPPGNCA